MPIIDVIRKSAQKSNSIVLKQSALTTRLNTSLEVDFFVDTSKSSIDYKDIKVKDIVSLGRKDGWRIENPSWYELIINWIYGFDWRDEVIDYFENDIEDKNFPAEHARGRLEIASLGGLLICDNGNHRLVGAACWALSNNGDEAILKKVRVATFPVNKYFKELTTILNDDDEIYLLQRRYHISIKKNYIKIVNKRLNYMNIYELKDDSLIILGSLKYKYFKLNFINNFFKNKDIKNQRLKDYISNEWSPINKHYFDIMRRTNN